VRQFSPPHLAALAVLLVAVGGSVSAGRRHPGRWTERFTGALALVIAAAWAGEYVSDVIRGTWSIRFTLPLQLTDAVSLTAIAALWTRRPLLAELTYFWAYTASLQAVLTPDLGQNFPDVLYFTYFGYHIGAIVAGTFLVYALGLYPRRVAVARVFAATLAWAAVAGTADVITGGNYMYLAWKPTHASLLRVMGPWPWYIVVGAGVALAMLVVVQLVTNVLTGHQRHLKPRDHLRVRG
jgi:hypothetical integral membrane protein (TIGR02206 family)